MTSEFLKKKYAHIRLESVLSIMGLVGDAVQPLPATEACDALSGGQLLSKLWLIHELDSLSTHYVPQELRMVVLGGWIGLLSNLIQSHSDHANAIRIIHSVDIDPRCVFFAERVNGHANRGTFRAITADMMQFDTRPYNVVINTSCEHLIDVKKWFSTLPPKTIAIVQSNDMYQHPQHRSCVPSVEAFAKQCPFSNLIMADALPCYGFTRFMLIGIV